MERGFSTRDRGLDARIAFVATGVVALAAAVPAAVVAVCLAEPAWMPYVVALSAVIVVTTAWRYRTPSALLLGVTGAEHTTPARHPTLYAVLDRLAALADVPTPQLATIDTPAANAFTVGTSRRGATIVVTAGLLDVLDAAELEAVLAHELAHVANRDASVMSLAGIPRTLGETMIAAEGVVYYVWMVVWWVGIPIWVAGTLLTLALSRYREFSADRGSALLTGRPAQLMSALTKLDGSDVAIPVDDLRRLSRVEALCVVANGHSRFGLFADHPPLEQRLARLAAMTRTQGKPVGP